MHEENQGAWRRLRSKPATPQQGAGHPAVRKALARFLAARGGSDALPTPEELRAYLEAQVAARGQKSAHADYACLQIAAAEHWGTEATAFFARVLREHRVTAKPQAQSRWNRSATAISRLPADWQDPFRELAARGRTARPGTKGLVWSEARMQAVAEALARWAAFCDERGLDSCPTGESLNAYADVLRTSGRIETNSIGDYLARILAGYHDVIAGTPPSPGALFVCRHYRDQKTAPTTKRADQIVGASAIYSLGLELFDMARRRPMRGTETATLARNGILLMLAAALGERSRALSALVFDQTLRLGPRPTILLDLPGEVLKGLQARKAITRRRESLHNPELWDTLTEYRTDFRPIFDGGDALFPSRHAMGQPLIEATLSTIVGRLTEKHLGVRITLHRVRDNVATEAVETISNGLSVAAGVLGHRDARTTAKHYDRAQGRAAMALLATLTGKKRGPRARLRV